MLLKIFIPLFHLKDIFLWPYANVLIPFLSIYLLSSKHDKDILLAS